MKNILVKIKSGRHDGLLGLYGKICDGCTPDDTIERGLTFERIDPEINFIWIDDPAPGVPLNSFAAVWEGYLYVTDAGSYRFFLDVDDGARLYIDNEIVIDRWESRGTGFSISDPLDLLEGPHKIRLEYYNEGPFGKIRLGWSGKGENYEIISSRYLYSIPSRSIIITGVPKNYKVLIAIEGEIREAIFRSGLAMIPLGHREGSVEAIIKILDEDDNPIYISPYIEIWPGDVYSLESIEA
ncbi:MAG: PA14 domain-containing protein [Sulfolobales archaeon]